MERRRFIEVIAGGLITAPLAAVVLLFALQPRGERAD
jgi:hypothetical protein